MTQIPLGLCQCGCGGRTKLAPQSHARLGWTRGEPLRFLPGHNSGSGPISPVLYKVDPETGCWVWQRAIHAEGYGVYKHRRAHRVFYEQHRGSIPESLTLDHLCRNRACVNPDHLEVVTRAVNLRRGLKARLTEDTVRYIKRSLPHRPQAEIARELGIHPSLVSHIKRGRLWKDVAA